MLSITFLKPSLTKARAIISALVLTVAPLAGALITAPAANATMSLTRLEVSGDNSRYFEDQSGKIVYLTGSHTWLNNVESGHGTPPPEFDYDEYLDFVTTRGGNFFRYWVWEQSRYSNETSDADYYYGPLPYNRASSGYGTGNDGLNKFDLTSFNQDYFDRMRERIEAAGEAGVYTAVMLFNGWSTECKDSGYSCGSNNQPFYGHPFNAANNINSINADTNSNGDGREYHELGNSAVTALQEAYIEKVIDTVGDLPNVLYEICNECDGTTANRDWQYEMVDYIHDYEDTEFGYNHPVGMSMQWPNANVTSLVNSNAEWISYGGSMTNPPVNDGTKVIIGDTDHACGTCVNTEWVWLAMVRGQNTTLMDVYDGAGYGTGAGSQGDKRSASNWENMRYNMGKSREWANQLDLKHMVPAAAKASTGNALVYDGSAHDDNYLVFSTNGSSSFTVDLSNTAGNVEVTWYDIETRTQSTASPVAGGSSTQNFTKPSSSTHGYALMLKEADTTNPTVSVTAPTASSTVSGASVTLSATASDNRTVAGVQFKVDGTNVGSEDTTSPYSVTWDSTSVGNGSHAVTAVARDSASNTTTSSSVSVTVDNGDHTNPTVSLTAPSAGNVSGSSVAVSASASDDVAVAGVQFKLDGVNLGSEDTSSPYSITWNTTLVPEGNHSLTAVARDTSNNTTTSTGVTVNVHNYTGLVAAYGFDNNTSGSTRLLDGSGNGYNLSCGIICATYTATGGHSSSGAYDFTGSGDWLQTSVETPFDFTTNMTVEYWMKTATWGGSWISMVTKGDTAWTAGRYGGYDSPAWTTYNGSSYHDARSGNYTTEDLNDGAWHHVALTYDGTYKKVYVDGTLTNTYNYSQTINNNGYPLSLGYNLEYTPSEYSGFLDDVRIYSRALSGGEISTDMSTPVLN